MPKLGEVGGFKAREKQLKAEIKTINEKRQYLEALKSSDLSDKEELVNTSLLKERDAYWLVNLLKLLADKYMFSLQSFSITPGLLTGQGETQGKIKESGLVGIGARVSFVGSKDKYVDFLLNIERILPILSIDKLETRSSAGTIVELQMTVTAYYHRQVAEKDIKKLTLADLKIGTSELAALERLAEFESLGSNQPVGVLTGEERKFVEYTRENPFSF